MNKMKYRPDIDGLRAIAVFAVIIYHANIRIFGIDLLPGGYIGVDVFFVISGFLISKIIFQEINENNFNFIKFYERRIRRLIPALFFICLTTIILGWFILLPDYYVSSSKSLISGIFFFSNIFFYLSGLEYDAQAAIYQPFLHLWSLSVEEQFYVFFPPLILLLFKINKKILIILLVLFLISLIFSEYLSKINSSLAFYTILTRSFELLAGVIIARLEFLNLKIKNEIFNSLLSKIGISLVILSFFLFNNETRHPSLITLIPVIGTALLIYCNNNREITTKFLSLKLLVFFGLISYSMYLWHYPIFVFNRLTNFSSGQIEYEIILGLGIILLSYLSYRFIEKPFRNKNFMSTGKIYLTLIISSVLLSFIALIIIYNNGFTQRVPNILKEHYETSHNLSEKTTQNNKVCFNRKNDFCHFKPKNNSFDPNLFLNLSTEHLST